MEFIDCYCQQVNRTIDAFTLTEHTGNTYKVRHTGSDPLISVTVTETD